MLKIGTCGFSFKDWKGTVYPSALKDSDTLGYYSKGIGLDTVEIDVSYYTFVSTKTIEGWIKKTPDDFLFTVKCHKQMTFNESGGSINAIDKAIFERFTSSYAPLAESGRLICFLAQFGPMFFRSKANYEYLMRFRHAMGELPLAIEFRHNSWLDDAELDATLEFLRHNNMIYTIVDLPGIRTLPRFIPAITSDVAFFRFHGRNKEWFNAGREKRYDYFYTDNELLEFLPNIRAIEGKAKLAIVYFNNCHSGSALRNAIRLKEMTQSGKFPNVYLQGELPLDI